MTRSGIPESVLAERLGRTHVEPLARAERMLAEIESATDALVVMEYAEVARIMAQRMKLGTAAENHATSIKLRAEIRLAEAVDAGQADGTIATQKDGGSKPYPDSGDGPSTLAEIGTTAQRLNEARLLRSSFTPEEVTQRAASANERGKGLSRDRLLREARDADAARRREQRAADTVTAVASDPAVDIREGDFRVVLHDIEPGTIDAIITDPPYPQKFLPLYADLAVEADRLLTPEGVMAVLVGQSHLPTAIDLLGSGRPYRWTMAYLTPGAGYVSHARRVQSNWKPVLVFGGGRRFGDVITSAGDDKRRHEWGQDFTAFSDLVERLTEPGHLVVDPFMGAGTTGAAARALGRRFVGCDVDPAAVAAARDRLG